MTNLMMFVQDPIYGEIKFTGILKALIESPIFQRLKSIDQGGAVSLTYPDIKTSRYDHSLGVSYLIRMLGGSVEEQVAGLLHDVSHTAFSHVIDYVVANDDEDYHEKIKSHFLGDTDLVLIFKNHQLDTVKIFNEENWPRLESPLPNLCADRVDYCLRDLFAWGKINEHEVKSLLGALKFEDGEIVICSEVWGQWFTDKFNNELINEVFNDPKLKLANQRLSAILSLALDKGILEMSDFLYDDSFILKKLKNSLLGADLKKLSDKPEISNSNIPTMKVKNRYIDPLVQVKEEKLRVSEYKSRK